MGILSFDPLIFNQSKSLNISNYFINLNDKNKNKNDNFILIYYKIRKELSKSADFSNQFSSFPLKQVNITKLHHINKFLPF